MRVTNCRAVLTACLCLQVLFVLILYINVPRGLSSLYLNPPTLQVSSLDQKLLEEPNANGVCDTFYGNSYSDLIPVCTGDGQDTSSNVSCHYSPQNLGMMCLFENVLVNPDSIRMVPGGETIEDVIGQKENEEMPQFEQGAFNVFNCTMFSTINNSPHHFKDALKSLSSTPLSMCATYEESTVLAITRYEYANLFHTARDWYNAFQALGMFSINGSVKVVLLDGHPAGALDSSWETVFGPTQFIKHTAKSCYRRFVLVSPGYKSPIFPNWMDKAKQCAHNSVIKKFRELFLSKHGVISTSSKKSTTIRVGYVLRKPYLAHPRQGKSMTSRVIQNIIYQVNCQKLMTWMCL